MSDRTGSADPGSRVSRIGLAHPHPHRDARPSFETDEERVRATARLLPTIGGNPALDRLAALAARLLDSGAAQVSLLTQVQTIAAGEGLAPGAVGSQGPLADSLCTVTARSGQALVVTDARTDTRVAALPPVATGQVGAYLGVPLVDAERHTVGALCVFGPAPREWSEADVALMRELAVAASAELELAALAVEYDTVRLRLGLAMDAAGIGSFDLDLTTGKLYWDERLIEMFGYDVDSFGQSMEAFYVRVHPDDVDHVARNLQEAIDNGSELDVDYRIVVPDGDTRWIAARGRALRGEDGVATRVLGAAYDTTDVRDTATRVARVLETMSAAFYSLDRRWHFSYVNVHAEQLLGRSREELIGKEVWAAFPDALGTRFESNYREAMRTGLPVEFEEYYPEPLDRWYEVRAWPGPDGLSVYFHDITLRRQAMEQVERARRDAERSRAEVEIAAARIDLLGEVSAQLAAELDPAVAVGRLAELVVPSLADFCIISTVHPRGQLHDVGVWHDDPAMRPVLSEYADVRLAAFRDSSYVRTAVQTGSPQILPTPAAAAIAGMLRPGRARDLIRQLAPEHAVALPLVARGRVLGVLTLFAGPARGRLNLVDFATASEVARRAAVGLDNVRLYRQQLNLAEGLQRAMLTAPAEPEGLQVEVRYLPAAEEAQVGGDWHDVFVAADGTTVLTIGDVVGHDTEAAAAMGQIRGLLRGIGYTTQESPADVLRRLDQAIVGLRIDTTATAVLARVERSGDHALVRYANAGHPPPLLISRDGSVSVLAGPTADLLLGIHPGAQRSEREVRLEEDATLLLYTDGLVERRGEDLEAGTARLVETLRGLGELPLDALCSEVLDRMVPTAAEDDVALVALRVRP